MKAISLIKKAYIKRRAILLSLLARYQRIFGDVTYVKLYYKLSMGRKLNLKNPRTFNEKLNWLKLYDHDPLYTTLVDKFAVKPWVAEQIGEQYVIPTIGAWRCFDEIEFDKLPNQFVLKTTHGGGNVGVVICKNKNTFNTEAARNKLEQSMKRSGYEKHREWPYKNVERKIIAEQWLEDNDSASLIDYKVHVFNGVPRFILVCQGREDKSSMRDDFYDVEWNLMKCRRPGHPNSETPMPKPSRLKEMLELSKILAGSIPFVRADFYIVNGNLYFGEMTFFPASGVKPFEPDCWDLTFGNWLTLPAKS